MGNKNLLKFQIFLYTTEGEEQICFIGMQHYAEEVREKNVCNSDAK